MSSSLLTGQRNRQALINFQAPEFTQFVCHVNYTPAVLKHTDPLVKLLQRQGFNAPTSLTLAQLYQDLGYESVDKFVEKIRSSQVMQQVAYAFQSEEVKAQVKETAANCLPI